MQIYILIMRNLKTKKHSATNLDLLSIMGNLKTKKQLQQNKDLLLIMRNPEDQKNCNKCRFTFNYAKP